MAAGHSLFSADHNELVQSIMIWSQLYTLFYNITIRHDGYSVSNMMMTIYCNVSSTNPDWKLNNIYMEID